MASDSNASTSDSAGRRLPIEQDPGVDLRQLRYFLAVAEELNFTRAAARLSLAQQALSTAIRELERALGVRLFSRSTRHVALTSAGEALVPAASRILTDMADALHAVQQAAEGRRGRLAVGVALAVHGMHVVREAIRRFAERSPDVDLQVTGYDHSDPSAGLATAASQVSFVLGPLTSSALESVTILEERRHVLLPSGHPLAHREAVVTRDLAGLPWLRVPAPESDWTRFWFRHPLGEPSAGPEIRSGVEWVPAVEAGRGVAYTLPTLAADYIPPEIVTVPVLDVEPGSVLIAWPADSDPLVEAFVATVQETVTDLLGTGTRIG
jgi:LysR family transcriptional regulator, benzoate and cis,cis-muconate-responsive activator of ben and cat genes